MGAKRKYTDGLKCPKCSSTKLRRSGKAAGRKFKPHRRYLCDNCGYYTINPRKI